MILRNAWLIIVEYWMVTFWRTEFVDNWPVQKKWRTIKVTQCSYSWCCLSNRCLIIWFSVPFGCLWWNKKNSLWFWKKKPFDKIVHTRQPIFLSLFFFLREKIPIWIPKKKQKLITNLRTFDKQSEQHHQRKLAHLIRFALKHTQIGGDCAPRMRCDFAIIDK